MATFKNTVYNMSAIRERIKTEPIDKANIHLFAKGWLAVLSIEQLNSMQAVLDNDYRVAKQIINDAKLTLKEKAKQEKQQSKQLTK